MDHTPLRSVKKVDIFFAALIALPLMHHGLAASAGSETHGSRRRFLLQGRKYDLSGHGSPIPRLLISTAIKLAGSAALTRRVPPLFACLSSSAPSSQKIGGEENAVGSFTGAACRAGISAGECGEKAGCGGR
jgi:hypothetical protein